ncbi:MAG: phage holin family protein [Candidatus Pacebacteria bacterium]|nr:phage holin family protein [Candidatus Paceibacterota bacterium]
MSAIISILINAFAVFASATIIPGVKVDSFLTSAVVAIVLGLLNAFVKPILLLLALPINVLTLGLFTLVINVVIIYIVDALIPGFSVNGFLSALLFGLLLSVVSGFLSSLT